MIWPIYITSFRCHIHNFTITLVFFLLFQVKTSDKSCLAAMHFSTLHTHTPNDDADVDDVSFILTSNQENKEQPSIKMYNLKMTNECSKRERERAREREYSTEPHSSLTQKSTQKKCGNAPHTNRV